jgi:carbamoyltransferase
MAVRNILGIAAGFHDASATILSRQGDILFAGHSERYSKIKGDSNISQGLVEDMYGFEIDHVAYYERPWAKQLRRLYSGEGIEWNKLRTRSILEQQLREFCDEPSTITKISSHNHHLSHAAAGFQTSPFTNATVVIIDAIGEWDTISIWSAEYDVDGKAKYKKLWGQKYPHSIGLFYSAITKHVGLKPNEEEYILMGMAAYGKRGIGSYIQNVTVENEWDIRFNQNLHLGFTEELSRICCDDVNNNDMAAGAQYVAETLVLNVMKRAKDFGWSNNLVYGGGVALNCSINHHIGEYFDNIWIMPNPGDAGSSLGAAALAYGGRVKWTSPYLGHCIPGDYPVDAVVSSLFTDRICGVASGRAEFGPRALGNRSLLADPRGADIKDMVNKIKRRQLFRPFAPVILSEFADEYFYMPRGWKKSPYMQTTALCKRPDLFPAICHADLTSRVQTVDKNSDSGIREVLEKWLILTGCPMLLNTSLNIRGEPMVNDLLDAKRFQDLYGIQVFS